LVLHLQKRSTLFLLPPGIFSAGACMSFDWMEIFPARRVISGAEIVTSLEAGGLFRN